jgi:hypothetical protein
MVVAAALCMHCCAAQALCRDGWELVDNVDGAEGGPRCIGLFTATPVADSRALGAACAAAERSAHPLTFRRAGVLRNAVLERVAALVRNADAGACGGESSPRAVRLPHVHSCCTHNCCCSVCLSGGACTTAPVVRLRL